MPRLDEVPFMSPAYFIRNAKQVEGKEIELVETMRQDVSGSDARKNGRKGNFRGFLFIVVCDHTRVTYH